MRFSYDVYLAVSVLYIYISLCVFFPGVSFRSSWSGTYPVTTDTRGWIRVDARTTATVTYEVAAVLRLTAGAGVAMLAPYSSHWHVQGRN